MTRGIYLIRCSESRRCYVGSSANIEVRYRGHLARLRRGAHHSIRLQRSWDKHGEGAFSLEIAEVVDSGDLFAAEQRWIDSHGEYNASPLARGRGVRFKNPHPGPSPDVRARIAEAVRGNTNRRGKKASAETCARIGLSKRGNKNRLGAKISAEVREQISAKLKGRPLSEETRRKMSLARNGRPHSPEHTAAIAAARKRNAQARQP